MGLHLGRIPETSSGLLDRTPRGTAATEKDGSAEGDRAEGADAAGEVQDDRRLNIACLRRI